MGFLPCLLACAVLIFLRSAHLTGWAESPHHRQLQRENQPGATSWHSPPTPPCCTSIPTLKSSRSVQTPLQSLVLEFRYITYSAPIFRANDACTLNPGAQRTEAPLGPSEFKHTGDSTDVVKLPPIKGALKFIQVCHIRLFYRFSKRARHGVGTHYADALVSDGWLHVYIYCIVQLDATEPIPSTTAPFHPPEGFHGRVHVPMVPAGKQVSFLFTSLPEPPPAQLSLEGDGAVGGLHSASLEPGMLATPAAGLVPTRCATSAQVRAHCEPWSLALHMIYRLLQIGLVY